MDTMSFVLGLLVGVVGGIFLLLIVFYLLAKPHFLKAKKQKEVTDAFMEQWVKNIADQSHTDKFGGGNS